MNAYRIHEKHKYSDYYEPRSYPSQIVPGKIITDYEHGILECPRCHTGLDPIPHGKSATCPHCDLYMERHGNALNVYSK